MAKNSVTYLIVGPSLLFHCLLRHYTISLRVPLFYYLFVTQLYYFFKVFIVPNFLNLFVTSLLCSRLQLSPLLFIASLYLQVSIVSLSVCYVIALFSASIVPSSDCYVTILHLQGFQCFSICLLRHCSVLGCSCLQFKVSNVFYVTALAVIGLDCSIFCLLRHYSIS